MPTPDTRRGPEARLSNEGRAFEGLFSRIAHHRLVKPIAKVLSIVAGLVVLALVGSTAKAIPSAPLPATLASASATATPSSTATATATAATSSAPNASAAPTTSPIPAAPPTEHARRATVDDPVAINAASLDDLRRLPGIGPKRAQSILDLRTKLGRFRQVEDLMRVKGIGRATLKKLRPLVRLD